MNDARSAEALGERIFAACLGAFDVFAMYLGVHLGYYEALADGPKTSAQLAAATDTEERYAREWLEQQAVAGIVDVEIPADTSAHRTFSLPAGHAEVFLDRDSPNYLGPAAVMTAAAGFQIPAVAGAFRDGGGVPWADSGHDMRYYQGEVNRPLFLHTLGPEWLAGIPDVAARLQGDGARVADVGCGYGWSAIGIATTFPGAIVDEFDVDEPSIAAGRASALEHGVADRVAFHLVDGATVSDDATYDLVIALECVHDMPNPVGVLAGMRQMAGGDGIVLVVDEATSPTFDPDAGPMEQFLYGFSITTCLPDGMSHLPSKGTGTVMRPGTFTEYAHEAGFAGVEILPVEHEQFRIYRLTS